MNSTLIQDSTRLKSFLEQKRVAQLEFPLPALLQLYAKQYQELYLEHFYGLKLLLQWLAPVSLSSKPKCFIPTYLITYEMQEIARLTGNHISQIYQELTELPKVEPKQVVRLYGI